MATPQERVVRFKNQKGDELCGTLRDAGGKARWFKHACCKASTKCSAHLLALLQQAVVLLVHGLMSLRDKVRFPEIAAALAERGVSSLRFDFSGNGDSGGDCSYANSFGDTAIY